MITKFPCFIGFDYSCHFDLQVNDGKYSASHLFQNMLPYCCEMSQFFLNTVPLSSHEVIGFSPLELPNRKWFGVIASSLFASTGTYASGLELIIFSTSINMLKRTSSVGFLDGMILYKTFLTERIKRSQAPPMWGEAGGLKFHFDVAVVNFLLFRFGRPQLGPLVALFLLRRNLSHYHYRIHVEFPFAS